MAILVANLGNSDLSVRPQDSEFYLPINFDRNEPNLIPPPVGSAEETLWNTRQETLCGRLCPELGVAVTPDRQGRDQFSFREFTDRLWQVYQANPEVWHDRIRPGRLWGVLRTAIDQFEVKEVYFFVTDQDPPHLGDTIYVYKILHQWFQKEIPDLKLYPVVLPQTSKAAVDTDALLQYYYQFFNERSRELRKLREDDQEILISIKGGTQQMQTALRVQSMATLVKFQANLEPELEVENVLRGLLSPCKAGVYWQYAKSQRYQAIKLLLGRYDFDGSEAILEDWKKFLEKLVEKNLASQEVREGNAKIANIIVALHVGKSCLSLDAWAAQSRLEGQAKVAEESGLGELLLKDHYDALLNLYTQCKIYYELQQAANFLTRMSSFYEQAQLRLVQQLGGEDFFERDDEGRPKDWSLDSRLLKQEGVWEAFATAMKSSPYPGRFRNHNFERNPIFEVQGRDNKTNFLRALLIKNKQADRYAQVLDTLSKLDFWSSTRNKIIHNAEGPSMHRLRDHLEYHRRWGHPLAGTACEPGYDSKTKRSGHGLLGVMAKICDSDLNLVHPSYRRRFVGRNAKLYLYDAVRTWVEEQLEQD